MKIITLWQPWATFIGLGWKTIETRFHRKFFCLLNQRIGIHAGMKWDDSWIDLAAEYITLSQIEQLQEMRRNDGIPFGQIICTAFVYKTGYLTLEHSQAALIDCGFSYQERTGLFLKEIKKLNPTIVVKGHQGIWNYDIDCNHAI